MNKLHDKSSNRKVQKINYDVFCKVVGRSCIVEELRETIFGTWLESKEAKRQLPQPKRAIGDYSKPKKPEIVEVLNRESAIFKPDESIKYGYDYLFEDVDIKDDCSFG